MNRADPGEINQRLMILMALRQAITRRAEVVAVVASAADDEEATTRLTAVLDVDRTTAAAVINMQMRHLTLGHAGRLDAEISELQAAPRSRA